MDWSRAQQHLVSLAVFRSAREPQPGSSDLGSVYGSRYSAISASLAGRPSAFTTDTRRAARTSSLVVAARGPAILDCHVTALDIAGTVEALTKWVMTRVRVARCKAVEKPDHRHRRLLR
jgi:hypothetical protein